MSESTTPAGRPDWKMWTVIISLVMLGGAVALQWSSISERLARNETEISAIKLVAAREADSNRREIDRMVRAVENLQGEIKDMSAQLRDYGRGKRP